MNTFYTAFDIAYLQCDFDEENNELKCLPLILLHLQDGIYLVSNGIVKSNSFTIANVKTLQKAKLVATEICQKTKLAARDGYQAGVDYPAARRLGRAVKGDTRANVYINASNDTITCRGIKYFVYDCMRNGDIIKVSSGEFHHYYELDDSGEIYLNHHRDRDEYAFANTLVDRVSWQYAKFIYNQMISSLIVNVYKLSKPGYYYDGPSYCYQTYIFENIESIDDAIAIAKDCLAHPFTLKHFSEFMIERKCENYFDYSSIPYSFVSKKGIEYSGVIKHNEEIGIDTISVTGPGNIHFTVPYQKGIEAFIRFIEIKEAKHDLEIELQRMLNGRWAGIK